MMQDWCLGNWFSAGYLIHREGELLSPNACRLSIGIPLTRSGALQWHTAYHFSTTQKGQSLIEMGVRMWR